MSIVRWEDPPLDRFRWRRAAEELHLNPGRWARVLEPTTKREATNCCVALKGHGCEVTTRTFDGKGIAVWARSATGNDRIQGSIHVAPDHGSMNP